ncbi:DUF2142 domain-containing protein [Leifsonia sp. ZF2019]|uniref:DUF2142 domain-containing protein n=1 Tax=Leifsonia sp. ZF2019 TaxID=2781978 RepID=UPI001CBC2911|nr:DUF2142 domain-containing protein [Leifsonia sp. ZF2019]UAJ80559.1 DUF2142 domain-containing protein [Leifsonia sp. ZF2019]
MNHPAASATAITAPRTALRFPWRLFSATFVLLFGLMTAWSLATPLYAVPDEASHAVRAATAVRGEIVGQGSTFQAPRYLTIPGAQNPGKVSCYAGRFDRTPACAKDPETGAELQNTLSSAGTNSPVYYLAVGLPSLLLEGAPALYAMRILSAALTALLFAAAATLLWCLPRRRWAPLLGLAVVTPQVLFLSGSINPNGIEVASSGSLLVSLLVLALIRPSGWLLWFSGTTAVVSTLLVTGGRSLALLWVVLATGAVITVMSRLDWRALLRRTSTWVVVGLLAIICLGQLYWFTRPENAVRPTSTSVAGSRLQVAQNMLEATVAYWRQMAGQGVVDYGMQELVPSFWTAIIFAVCLLPVVLGRGRQRWVTLGLVIVFILVPVVTQVALWRQVGDVWQGRYILAVLLMLAITGGLALDRAALGGTRRTVSALRAVLILLAVGQLVAFATVVRRYAVVDSSWIDALFRPSWLPPGGTIGLILLMTVLLALGAVLVWRSLPGWFAEQDEPAAPPVR